MPLNCPKCDSTSTRRIARKKSLTHRLMYFLGRFPWECLACQKLFFNPKRYTRSTRNPMGEVYTGTLTRPAVEPGSKESPSH
jgi:hypothetical protein